MKVTGKTKIVGLIGNPVKHSVSPEMHNAAFDETDLDFIYVTFKVKNEYVEEAIKGIKSLNITGANVTIPYKSTVMTHLDEIKSTAEKIGAVNTIVRKNSNLIGHNTDGQGVLKSLEDNVGNVRKKKVMLLGAGGAARAIGFTLADQGVNLTISNRSKRKGEKLATEILEKTGIKVKHVTQEKEKIAEELEEKDILIDSTPVGMHPNENKSILSSEEINENLTVMDIVYNPRKTKLLKEAEKAGAETVSGLEMLVYQGAASFELWTGETPPVEKMFESVEKALED